MTRYGPPGTYSIRQGIWLVIELIDEAVEFHSELWDSDDLRAMKTVLLDLLHDEHMAACAELAQARRSPDPVA